MKKLALLLTALFGYLFAFGQTIQIKDSQFKEGFHFGRLSDRNFRTIYKIRTKDPQRAVFRKIDFDTQLNMLDTTLIEFIGDFNLIESITNNKYTATLFGSRLTAQVILHIINNETEQQNSFPIKLIGPWTGQTSIMTSRESDNFFVVNKHKKLIWELQKIDLHGNVIWHKTIEEPKEKFIIEKIVLIEGNRLGLIISKNPGSRAALNEIKILDAGTGAEVYTQRLYDKLSKSTMDNSFHMDSLLYLTGRKFFTDRVSQNTTGLPYLREFKSDSVKEIKLTSSLMTLKTFWMDLIVDENGNRYLVGETFTNESRGAYFMKNLISAMMTMGILSVSWTVLKFQDAAIISIDNPNVPAFSLIKLTPRRVQIGNYTPGYTFAKYSYHTGQVRYWGHDRRGNIYLVDGNTLKKYNLATRVTEELGQLPAESSQIVVHTSDDHLVYLNRRKLNNLVEFKVVELKK